MIDTLKNIIGKKVKRFFLIVWPPFGETDMRQIDISAGLVFENSPNKLLKISTDKNELTTPTLEHLYTPSKYFEWENFYKRMESWIRSSDDMEFDTEYYEVTNANIFQNIVNEEILDVELVRITNQSLIGIKLVFKNDYILSTPLSDGNTLETKIFNKNGNLNHFTSIGKIEYCSLKSGCL